jgi:hypothetical protein
VTSAQTPAAAPSPGSCGIFNPLPPIPAINVSHQGEKVTFTWQEDTITGPPPMSVPYQVRVLRTKGTVKYISPYTTAGRVTVNLAPARTWEVQIRGSFDGCTDPWSPVPPQKFVG